MTRAALALLLSLPAHAGDTAPIADLVPQEWQQVRAVVIEVTCLDLGDCCGVHRECGDWHQRAPDPAPVPLPPAGLMLTTVIAALAMKGKRHA